MQRAFHLLPLLPLTAALGIYNLPPVPSQLTVPASVATYAASVAASQATALSVHNGLGISSGAPNPKLPDPCGPPIQAPGRAGQNSTCYAAVDTNHTTDAAQAYGVTCLENPTTTTTTSTTVITSYITQDLDANACANAMIELCYTLAGSYGPPATDRWVFTNGTSMDRNDNSYGADGGGNCTVGFWLPEGGAPPPSFLRCVDGIFSPLLASCGTKMQSGGTGGNVNLKTLPSMNEGNGNGGIDKVGIDGNTGSAVDPGYPSYFLMA